MRKIFSIIQKKANHWMYFGLGKDTALKFRSEINDDNMSVARSQCIAVTIIIFLAAIACIPVSENPNRPYVLFGFSIIFALLSVFLIVMRMSGRNISGLITDILLILYVSLLCSVCIYNGVFGFANAITVIYVAFAIFIQVDFDVLPMTNLVCLTLSNIDFLALSFLFKDYDIFIYDLIDIAITSVLGMFVSWHKAENKWKTVIAYSELKEKNDELFVLSTTDRLTGLSNHTYTIEQMQRMIKSTDEDNTKICCMIADIDWFKKFNDTYGHLFGDHVLKNIGDLLKKFSDENHLNAGRIGGEEFMLFWREEGISRCADLAEKLLTKVREMDYPFEGAVSVSIGVAESTKTESNAKYLYQMADNALYKVKEHGRNCCWKYIADSDEYIGI